MTRRSTTIALEDQAMPVQAKLAAARASFLFLPTTAASGSRPVVRPITGFAPTRART